MSAAQKHQEEEISAIKYFEIFWEGCAIKGDLSLCQAHHPTKAVGSFSLET